MSDPLADLVRMAEEDGLYDITPDERRKAAAWARLQRNPKALEAVEHAEARIEDAVEVEVGPCNPS